MKPIIRVENLSKQYTIGAKAEPYATLRESLVKAARKPIDMVRGNGKTEQTKFWALKDINFDVMPGEVVGIIGRNGAGKSTLLKILSRITEPTTGRVELYGRVGSLLEVGTGFHPELTGRENIFLNGAILGMRREEISKKFDEIVDFAEIEDFLDTPVKRYSSGMYVRLAFAVAAHLEPEVLVVDEVLAVGDVQFQKKCLGKMRDVSEHGRTVLFVSHDMQTVSRLCRRIVWLGDGTIRDDGESARIVGSYLKERTTTGSERIWDDPTEAPGSDIARLRRVRVCNSSLETIETTYINQGVGIEIVYDVAVPGHVLTPNVHVFNESGVCIFVAHNLDPEWRRMTKDAGTYTSRMWIPANFLAEGTVFVTAALATYEPLVVHFVEWDAIAFEVIDVFDGLTARGDYAGAMPGLVRPIFEWETGVNSLEK